MTIETSQFWIVYNPNGPHTPRHWHTSMPEALEESKRLARLHPGSQFYVMEAVAGAEKPDVSVHVFRKRDKPDWELPF